MRKKVPFLFLSLVLSLFILLVQPIVLGAPSDSSFYFVQITDTHYGEKENIERTERVIDAISKMPMKIGFVAHTGDITSTRIYDEKLVEDFKRTIGRLELPIYYAPGNHDILSYDLDETYRLFSEHFNPPFYQIEYSGVICLFAYLGPLPKSLSGGTGLERVEQALKNAGDKPVIIFQHIPVADDFYNNRFSSAWTDLFRQRFVEMINTYNVKAVIAGHFHRDELHWLGRVPLFVSGPVAGYWKRQATYRIYEYRDGQISYRTQYVE